MCKLSSRSTQLIDKGTVCVCCQTTHNKKRWYRAFLLNKTGRNLASKELKKHIHQGFCCNRVFQWLKRKYVALCIDKIKKVKNYKIRKEELQHIETVPFETLIASRKNQTYSIIAHDDNQRSVLVLKRKADKVTSKKNQLKILGAKCIPLNSLIVNASPSDTMELMAKKKDLQDTVKDAKWFKSNSKIQKKRIIKQVNATIRKRKQLMAPLQTFGTNTPLSTAKLMNIINSKQTNKERISNTYLKNPLSRIRACFHDPIFEKYVCDMINNSSVSMKILATNILAELKAKSNDILNKINPEMYDKILKSFENQQKHSLNTDIPTILKYLYIDHYLNNEMDLQQICDMVDKVGGSLLVEKEGKWQEVARTLKITQKFGDEICRFGYFLQIGEKPPIRCFQRRNVKLDDDIYMPFFDEKEMKEDLQAWCIGQEIETDIDESVLYSVDEWCEAFKKNPLAVYIGNPIKVPINLNGKEIMVNGVMRNIIPVLIHHLLKCDQNGFIKQVADLVIGYKLIDWMDGTAMLNQSLTKVSIQLLWDEKLFNKEGYDYVTKPLPLTYVWCSETKYNVKTISQLLRDQYTQLVDFKMPLHEKTATFKLKFMSADYSNASKRWNHKVGGDYRCSKCPLPFTGNQWDYEQCLSCLNNGKSLQNLYATKKFPDGQVGLPHLVNDGKSTSLKERGLDEYENGSEILHVTKGIGAGMFSLFQKEKDFQEEKCYAALDENIRLNAKSSTMSNGDWRLVFCKYDVCVLPFVNQERENAELLMLYWRDILRFLYSKNEHSNIENQQFCVKVFVFGTLAVMRWGNNVVGLHFHDLWVHISLLVWKVNVYHLSAEKSEQAFSKEKRIAKNNTNHKTESAIVEIIRRSVLSEVVKQNYSNRSCVKSNVEKALKDIPIVPSVIPKAIMEHPKYSKWLSLFESKILAPNYPNFLKYDCKGHIMHGDNSELSVEFERLLEKCVITVTALRGKSKCPFCKKTEVISIDCLSGSCFACCEDSGCVFHTKIAEKLEKNKKKNKSNVPIINNSQANASQDSGNTMQLSNNTEFNPTTVNSIVNSEKKVQCVNDGCTLIKVSINCSNKMCSKCCKNVGEKLCKQHKITNQRRKSVSEQVIIQQQTVSFTSGSLTK
ncbi:predicted protein [Naegleria gruberi]|uniref:Predicted protein n=1 Tax=Naegleria gruberi TaxID=5762 RepID=D2W293_NAEGR|nr:uncharacterized protein NAEGRDRAFT_54138 [Naegleria gruberi]EFC36823.1 predicted protein [Naegleria gruberi]|eukprot:XP_002669567.1 predicted protein [Naegleria gruberi strain NEG-M]